MEEEDKTAQPLQSTREERTRGDQVVLSGETIIVPCSQNIQYKKPSILVSCLPVTTTVKKLPDK
jgi:hypothetical protein